MTLNVNRNAVLVGVMLAASGVCNAAGCPYGTVWREATAGDLVCVSPQTRAQAWQDNRTNPHETCPRGLVWREATPTDHVCVDPGTRARTWDDNAHAPRDTDTKRRVKIPKGQRID